MPRTREERVDREGEAEFVMSFLSESDKLRQEFVPIWEETLQNYLVIPLGYSSQPWSKQYPLDTARPPALMDYSVLKDSESHQVVETLLSSLCLMLLGEPGYIVARRIGVEDTYKASTVSRLLEYALNLPSHFRATYQWFKSGFIFGTGVVGLGWEYEEATQLVRSTDYGIGYRGVSEMRVPYVCRDDPQMYNVDVMDFWPDPGEPLMERMRGCAERVYLTARGARALADQGKLDSEAVERAIAACGERGSGTDSTDLADKSWREGLDIPLNRYRHQDFIPMIGYRYWGEVPWRPANGGDDWRCITILNGENVGSRDWPLLHRRLPFYDVTFKPMPGRFYGVSELEVSRFAQDLTDTLTMMVADAAVRMVHPPWLVDENSGTDYRALKRFRWDNPVRTRNMAGVRQLEYSPPIERVNQIAYQTKQSIRERTGALDANQGLPFGTKRLSASEATLQARAASARMEILAMMAERDALPPLGTGLADLFKLVLVDDQEIVDRIGESPDPSPLSDLLDVEHDVRFVGSRLEHDKQSRLDMNIKLAQTIASLPVAARFPWGEWMGMMVRDADMHELEALIDQPNEVMLNAILGQMQGRGAGAPQANGNGEFEGQPPMGLMPAQAAGEAVG